MITQDDINITAETNALLKISIENNLLWRETQYQRQCDILDRIRGLDSALDKQIYALVKQGNVISTQISATAERNASIAEQTSAIAELKATLAERTAAIAELRTAFRKLATIVAAMRTELRTGKILSQQFVS